jgi:hypothetical protein
MHGWLSLLPVALLFGFVIYQIARQRGWLPSLETGDDAETIGRFEATRQAGLTRLRVRVHHLPPGDAEGRVVGLELALSAPLAYRLLALKLSRADAEQLATLLQQGARPHIRLGV